VATLVVSGLVVLTSAVIWHEMAGERLRLAQQAASTSTTAHAPARPPLRERLAAPSGGVRSSSTGERRVTDADTPTTISGTPVAVTLIAGLQAAAVLVIRALRRRQAADGHLSGDDLVADPEPENEDGARHASAEVALGSTPAQLGETAPSVPEVSGAPRVGKAPHVDLGGSVSTGTPRGKGSKVVLYDRRLSQRVEFEARARLQWPGHDVTCMTVDLSLRGVRCRLWGDASLPSPPSAGTPVRLTLRLDGTLATLEARVEWRRLEPGGPVLGLQFVQLGDVQRALLRPIVTRGTPPSG
jgi:hypothetical protein